MWQRVQRVCKFASHKPAGPDQKGFGVSSVEGAGRLDPSLVAEPGDE